MESSEIQDEKKSSLSGKKLLRNNLILLSSLIILILFFPVFHVRDSGSSSIVVKILITLIIISSIFALDYNDKIRNRLIFFNTICIAIIWLDYIIIGKIMDGIYLLSIIVLTFYITITMIWHIAVNKKVSLTLIISAINGYLLIGLTGAFLLVLSEILNYYIFHLNEHAINFANGAYTGFHDFIYFSFITLTTIGYGDITPNSEIARSITLILGMTGQLYLTVLVAMLVGKYASSSN